MKIGRETAKLKRLVKRVLARKTEHLDNAALVDLRFYQFKETTAKFFFERFGRTDIRVRDTPHYAFAKSLCSRSADGEGEEYYREYLAASWGSTQDAERVNDRIREFEKHFEHCRNTNRVRRPTLTRMLNTEELFVVDGNHRTAMIAALNKATKVEILPPNVASLVFLSSSEFYGNGFRDMPYQSVFLNGEEIIRGRRDDALARLKMIPRHVIDRASIVDVASNIGMSSLFASRLGASNCLGLEISKKMVDLASRFAMFDGQYPSVRFKQFNIDQDELDEGARYDTAFMFSIHDHLAEPSRLVNIVDRNVKRWVVFEGHPNGKKSDYANFFDSGLFRTVEELGALPESIYNKSPNRVIWLCEKNAVVGAS